MSLLSLKSSYRANTEYCSLKAYEAQADPPVASSLLTTPVALDATHR